MERLDSKTLALDISVNLDRIGRFMQAERHERVEQSIDEVKNYAHILEQRDLDYRFAIVFKDFLRFLNTSSKTLTVKDTIDSFYFFSTVLQNRAEVL